MIAVRGDRLGKNVGRFLCILALLFASGDVWPTVSAGFTFRLSQLAVLLAAALYTSMRSKVMTRVPGVAWLYCFLIWITATLPASVLVERSVGYAVWAITDVLIVCTFLQFFGSIEEFLGLLRWFLISFVAVAIFGWVQLAVGLTGHSLLVTEWWIPGILPRINGLSYEPSYYATYLMVGWILSCYLIETRSAVPPRSLQWTCVLATTSALIICTSRMGWLMMCLWVAFRALRSAVVNLIRGAIARSTLRLSVAAMALGLVGVLAIITHEKDVAASLTDVSFLMEGLGLFGESSHSTTPRVEALDYSWRSFLDRPIMGCGIGALPEQIAEEKGERVYSLKDAKANEGLSIFVELLASTGVVGGVLIAAFAAVVIRRFREVTDKSGGSTRSVLAGLGWAVVWLLIILQFNQNFLRIYLYTDLAVLLAAISVVGRALTAQGGDYDFGARERGLPDVLLSKLT